LAAGVIEEGTWTAFEDGVPQGASASPLLANVYLHYVFDLWAHQWRTRHAHGDVVIVRFADDCVPRTLKEGRCRSDTDGCGAAREMKEPGRGPGGPSWPPCRGRPQTTARCAGQESGC